ncbi:glycosyltransferase family 4 protein [Alicyclobacillus acidiphilus]|uniref:glycosyltransferase family 4 protein n=1 Tax=Alicyclobacillus acidiphilus TaxID=182455 RepID=UPI00082C21C6|nr:glycosyltransferase family 1 protein [Alicyclobacillus acidiphilus]
MRIAMFTETFLPSTDGIVTRLCATLKYLERKGHEVLLFAPSGSPSTYASATIVGIPAYPFILYPEKRYALPMPRIGRRIKQFRPDLIHAVNPAFLGIGGVYYAWKFRLPFIASYHTNVPGYARHYKLDFLEPALWWYFRTLHNRAHLNLATSKATLRELEEHGFLNLDLWERGVDVELFQSAKRSEEMRKRLAPGAGPSDPVLLYVGRLASEKNIDRIRPCLDAIPNLHLAIVGDGPYRPDLERIFAGTNAHFTGYMHGTTLAEAYASADAFLFPSTTETLGLVLFEAMAAGLPVLAADSAPTREVLEDGRAGFIFDPTSTESMIQLVKDMISNSERREQVRARGLEIAQTLDWDGPSEQLLGHYERVCQMHALVPSPVQSPTR